MIRIQIRIPPNNGNKVWDPEYGAKVSREIWRKFIS